MKTLKRHLASDPYAANISSKVFVRQAPGRSGNGRVQKVVREVYLRRDIPCSSRLCATCMASAPAGADGTVPPFILSDRPAGTAAFPSGHYIMPDTNAQASSEAEPRRFHLSPSHRSIRLVTSLGGN